MQDPVHRLSEKFKLLGLVPQYLQALYGTMNDTYPFSRCVSDPVRQEKVEAAIAKVFESIEELARSVEGIACSEPEVQQKIKNVIGFAAALKRLDCPK